MGVTLTKGYRTPRLSVQEQTAHFAWLGMITSRFESVHRCLRLHCSAVFPGPLDVRHASNSYLTASSVAQAHRITGIDLLSLDGPGGPRRNPLSRELTRQLKVATSEERDT